MTRFVRQKHEVDRVVNLRVMTTVCKHSGDVYQKYI